MIDKDALADLKGIMCGDDERDAKPCDICNGEGEYRDLRDLNPDAPMRQCPEGCTP